MSLIDLSKLVPEDIAYEQFGYLLGCEELRHARQRGELAYYKNKSKILYHIDELLTYIEAAIDRSYVPCRKSLSSESIGSPKSLAPAVTTVVGMTPELERLASEVLRQEISIKLKSNSPHSSLPKAKLRLVTPEK